MLVEAGEKSATITMTIKRSFKRFIVSTDRPGQRNCNRIKQKKAEIHAFVDKGAFLPLKNWLK